jgi:hypothetical protein
MSTERQSRAIACASFTKVVSSFGKDIDALNRHSDVASRAFQTVSRTVASQSSKSGFAERSGREVNPERMEYGV